MTADGRSTINNCWRRLWPQQCRNQQARPSSCVRDTALCVLGDRWWRIGFHFRLRRNSTWVRISTRAKI